MTTIPIIAALNEGERIGGIRKMILLPTRASLGLRIIKEFIRWK